MTIRSFTQDPDSVLDYKIDYTRWLAGDVIISGAITGTSASKVSKTGVGRLTLSADNSSFSGAVEILNGSVRISNAAALGDVAGATTVAANTSLELDGSITVAGQYGVLTIQPNGDYTYTRNPGTPGGVTETFRYVLTVSEGDREFLLKELKN